MIHVNSTAFRSTASSLSVPASGIKRLSHVAETATEAAVPESKSHVSRIGTGFKKACSLLKTGWENLKTGPLIADDPYLEAGGDRFYDNLARLNSGRKTIESEAARQLEQSATPKMHYIVRPVVAKPASVAPPVVSARPKKLPNPTVYSSAEERLSNQKPDAYWEGNKQAKIARTVLGQKIPEFQSSIPAGKYVPVENW